MKRNGAESVPPPDQSRGFESGREEDERDAEPLHRRALSIREAALGPDHPDVATSLTNLAALYQVQGRYADAEPLHRRALVIDEAALGPDHPSVATDLNNLAELYRVQSRNAEAEPLYQRALAIRETTLGTDHPTTESFESFGECPFQACSPCSIGYQRECMISALR